MELSEWADKYLMDAVRAEREARADLITELRSLVERLEGISLADSPQAILPPPVPRDIHDHTTRVFEDWMGARQVRYALARARKEE